MEDKNYNNPENSANNNTQKLTGIQLLHRDDYESDYIFLIECSKVWDVIGKNSWNKYYVSFFNNPELKILSDDELFSKLYELTPNLDGANLSCLTLTGINLCCASLKNADLRGTDLSKGNLIHSDLTGAILTPDLSKGPKYTTFEDANLQSAILDNAKMHGTIFKNTVLQSASIINIADAISVNFENAILTDAHLDNSKFSDANLEGTLMLGSYLKGTMFYLASVNGKTIFTGHPDECISDSTDFTGVGLSSARISPNLLPRLQRNIRKIYWDKWCSKHKVMGEFVNFFWKLSDYGSSMIPCIQWLVIWYFGSLLVYIACTFTNLCTSFNTTLLSGIGSLIELLGKNMFAMFGSGYIIVENVSGFWHTFGILFAGIQTVFTYFLLAILITRFGIMFRDS